MAVGEGSLWQLKGVGLHSFCPVRILFFKTFFLSSLTVSYNVFWLYLFLNPQLFPFSTHPILGLFLFFFLSPTRPICAAHILLDVWSSAEAWLMYQGCALGENCLSSQQLTVANSSLAGGGNVCLASLQLMLFMSMGSSLWPFKLRNDVNQICSLSDSIFLCGEGYERQVWKLRDH